jgi:hypothetical protein
MVLSAGVLKMLDQPTNGISGRYIIAHELAHVQEHYIRDQVLPNTLLKRVDAAPDAAVLFCIAEAMWTEYVACFLSAPIYPEQASVFESTVVVALERVTQSIIAAKMIWQLQEPDDVRN